ncbi:MAG: FAD-dependent oxidoreductase, partial [Chloroflexi bacterium]|nr:FAD-dependent oxidoreductase [Chloroflexota bacterium]
ECGVEVRLFTKVIDVEKDPDRLCVRGAVVHNVEGYRHIRAKAFIDATGDAVLSDLCGVGCREPGKDTPKAMGATLCSLFGGISWDSIGMGGVNGAINPADEEDALARALADDHFTQCDHHLPGMHRIGKSTGHLNGGHIFDLDPLNCASLTAGMISGRKIVREYESFYRKYVRGFQDSELVVTASSMGVRESRRISGEYELRYDDYCARRQFSDQIGVYNKFVDIHPYDLSAKELMRYRDEIQSRATWLREGECYGIPYGILVPRNSVNLWVAGRCNSSDIKVHGAIRVQPACSMMGQAAGTAAVQSVSSHQTASGLDTAELVLALRRADAYLPQANLSKTMSRTSAV